MYTFPFSPYYLMTIYPLYRRVISGFTVALMEYDCQPGPVLVKYASNIQLNLKFFVHF